ENLKLPTEDQVILEGLASSTGTLSSLQNLDKDLSFTIPIHQDTSLVPPMTTPFIDLTTMQSDSPLPTSIGTTSIITTTTSLPPPPQPRQSIAYPILVSRIGELEQHMADLIQNNLALEERLDKQGTRLYNLENLNITHKVSQAVDEIVSDTEEARKKKRKKYVALRTPSGSPPSPPPPPPPPSGASGAPGISGASGSSQLPPPPLPPFTGTSRSAQQHGSKAPSSSKPTAFTHRSMAWTTSDTRFESTGFMAAQELSPTDSLMQDNSIPDEQWKPLPEEERLVTPEPAWTIPSSNVLDIENNWASTLVSTYETPAENSLLAKTRDMTTFLK
ncbi:hypothetical protein Tco_1511171, partial [Tanacetum coccineum]